MSSKRNHKQTHFLPSLSKMRSLYNAVTDTLEELELEDHIESHIREVVEDRLYHVTFQEIENGNNRCVVSVEYQPTSGDLLDDDSWEETVNVTMIARDGIQPMMCQLLMELLAITIDADYFDSDDDDDTASTVSQPLTPPPSRVRQR
jgi:hypothetical protein